MHLVVHVRVKMPTIQEKIVEVKNEIMLYVYSSRDNALSVRYTITCPLTQTAKIQPLLII